MIRAGMIGTIGEVTSNLATDFSGITTTPASAQAITSITTGGVYTPTAGADILSGWDFTDGWSKSALATIIDLNSFSTTGGGGPYKAVLTEGERYEVVIDGSTTANNFFVATVQIGVASTGFGTGAGTHYVTVPPNHTALAVYNIDAGTTDITTLTLKSLGPATGAQVVSCDEVYSANNAPTSCCTDPDDDQDVTTGWVIGNSASLDSVAGGKTDNCLEVTENGANNPYAQSGILTVSSGKVYNFKGYVKAGTEATYKIILWDQTNGAELFNSGSLEETAGDWSTEWDENITIPSNSIAVKLRLYQTASSGSATTILFDDVTFKQVLPIGHGETIQLHADKWTGPSCELVVDPDLNLDKMVSDVQDPLTFSKTDPAGVVTINEGADLLDGWDFTSGWSQTDSTISTATTFTANSADGRVYKNYDIMSDTKYEIIVDIDASVGTWDIYLAGALVVATEDGTFEFSTGTLADGLIRIRASNNGATITVNTLELREVKDNTIFLTNGDRDEDYYVTKDFGADYFGDFSMHVDVNVTALTDDAASYFYAWALSNADDDLKDIDDASGSFIGIRLIKASATTYAVQLIQCDSGTLSSIDISSGISVNTKVFIGGLARSSTTLSTEIYSTNALRVADGAGDVDTITGTVISTKFQYVYGLGSYNAGLTAKGITAEVSNLRINEIDSGNVIPIAFTAPWTSDDDAVSPQCTVGGDGEQQLVNSDFDQWTEGSELVTGTDSDMSGANNWGSSLAVWNVNSTVAGKMYMLGDGSSDTVYLTGKLTLGKQYSFSLKAELDPLDVGGMAETEIFIAGGISTGVFISGFTPTTTEATFTGTFIANDTVLRIGSGTGFNGIAFSIDDVLVKEVTPTGWTIVGTLSTTNYMVYDTTNNTVRIVSDGNSLGLKQSSVVQGDQTQYPEVNIDSVTSGNIYIYGGSGDNSSTPFNDVGVNNDYYKTTAIYEDVYLGRYAAACDITVNSFKLWKVSETFAWFSGEQAGDASLTQSSIITSGAKNKTTFILADYSAGSLAISSPFTGTGRTSDDTYTEYGVAANTNLVFTGNSTFAGKISSTDLEVIGYP